MTTEEEQIAAKEAVREYSNAQAVLVSKKIADEAIKVAREVAKVQEQTSRDLVKIAADTAHALEDMSKDINILKEDFKELARKQSEKYVTQDQFWPVRTIVYSGAGIVLVSVCGAILALVIIGR